ncbi:SRPBCC domain-containing protein [Fulvimarina endophytica]|uniref:SRPBCC domain-containing protein n=1 Tax=Fulvimarina endophytica TaxID=2293836 RepID=A0A371XAD0_9HYPH|nr:SRPBCC domain-containing protein [Fulvimarina endophytica]RFC66161.1 SRPBCC domain-containing protein [Fulvimarina endophytica]
MTKLAAEDGEFVAQDDGKVVIRKEIAASRQAVWHCLTEPDCLKAWWRENIEFEPQVGGRFTEPWVDPSGRNRTTRAQVTSYHPLDGFVMVWADDDWAFDTVVSVTLSETEIGTEVRIEHQGWEKAPEVDRATMLLDHQSGWTAHLGNLANYVEDQGSGRHGGH